MKVRILVPIVCGQNGFHKDEQYPWTSELHSFWIEDCNKLDDF